MLRLDHESSFKSEPFRKNSEEIGMRLQFYGVESHNSIGAGEKYHEQLGRIFKKIKGDIPRL